jgi:hypothetical protein
MRRRANTIRLPDGSRLDIPEPVRCFNRFTSEERANKMASRRQGYRQRQQEGDFFWVHEMCPGIAFRSRGQAITRILETLSLRAARASGAGDPQ